MNTSDRLRLIEAKIKSKHGVAVLIVDANTDGTYTLNGKIYTRQQFEEYVTAKGVEHVIIDDI